MLCTFSDEQLLPWPARYQLLFHSLLALRKPGPPTTSSEELRRTAPTARRVPITIHLRSVGSLLNRTRSRFPLLLE